MTRRRVAALAATVLLAAGCSASLNLGDAPGRVPGCPAVSGWTDDGNVPPIVLMAQAVPTASLLPCIATLPAGVTFDALDTRSGLGRFWLNAGHEGRHAIRVTLTRDCVAVRGSAEQSPQPGVTRYVQVDRAGSKYEGDWFHVFPGGCVTYHFALHTKTGDASIAAISAGLSFVSRAAVARWVHDNSDGRLDLDPPPTARSAR
jgi:hypothetical protein